MRKKEIYFLTLIIILIALSTFFLTCSHKQNFIIVKNKDHQELLKVPLDINGIYEIEGDYGLFHLEVKDQEYRAIDVSCPNKLCEQVGWVNETNYRLIVCLPNGLYVELSDE